MSIIVVLPRPGAAWAAGILPASAIVVVDHLPAAGRAIIDYEGDRYGMTGLARFADRVASAAGRAITGYPTVARMHVPADELVAVARYDAELGEVLVLDEPSRAALAAWLGRADLPETELVGGGSACAMRRDLRDAERSADPAIRARADLVRRMLPPGA